MFPSVHVIVPSSWPELERVPLDNLLMLMASHIDTVQQNQVLLFAYQHSGFRPFPAPQPKHTTLCNLHCILI